MLDQHPIARWVTVGTLISAVAVGTWFIMDERERSIDQSDRLADIRKEQVNIRKELALQTADLEEVRGTQTTIVHAIERGNDRIVDAVSRGSLALAVELGRVAKGIE